MKEPNQGFSAGLLGPEDLAAIRWKPGSPPPTQLRRDKDVSITGIAAATAPPGPGERGRAFSAETAAGACL